MVWLKNKKKKIVVSLAAGMAAAVLVTGDPIKIVNKTALAEDRVTVAWWGTLYPEFCFSDIVGEKKKIGFALWLALSSLW